MSEIRVLPLPKVTGIWDHDVSRYPDRIRIPMSDGKVVTYLIDSQLPHPCFMAAIRNIRKMKKTGERYQHSPAREQKTIYRGHCTTEREEK